MNILEVKNKLDKLKTEKQKSFSEKIIKNKHEMLGVSIPNLKKLAKEICKEDALMFLQNNTMQYYEEVMLQGFVIAFSKIEIEKKFDFVKNYIKNIKDWSQCDSVVCTLKFFNYDLNKTYNFLLNYFKSNKEFEKRFAIISYLVYFLNDEYINDVLEKLTNCNSELYYVQMAVAWALSVCFVKYYDKTLTVFKNCQLNKFTFNATIQKCVESFRIDKDKKEYLKTLKK